MTYLLIRHVSKSRDYRVDRAESRILPRLHFMPHATPQIVTICLAYDCPRLTVWPDFPLLFDENVVWASLVPLVPQIIMLAVARNQLVYTKGHVDY